MEHCEICGKPVKQGWERRMNNSGKENIYFCSQKCEEKWCEKEYGIRYK